MMCILFNNLEDKSPQIGLMHDWYDYALIKCSFFPHLQLYLLNKYVCRSSERGVKILQKKYFPLSRFF
jgi:hypothetical protein